MLAFRNKIKLIIFYTAATTTHQLSKYLLQQNCCFRFTCKISFFLLFLQIDNTDTNICTVPQTHEGVPTP
jgi:hypothetical protein